MADTKKTQTTSTTTETNNVAFAPGVRLEVFSIKATGEGKPSVWTRAGSAFVNRDGSMNVYLDVLPLDGKLHIRRTVRGEEKAADETKQN